MKPTLCCDADLKNIKFPIAVLPKIDGVRGLNFDGVLTGRSLKKHKNKYVTDLFSDVALIGFDGEMANEQECHPDLCRITSSALSTIEGTPWIAWHLFDYVTPITIDQPYIIRYEALLARVKSIATVQHQAHLWKHLFIVPLTIVNNMEELEALELHYLSMGYEGVILRDPQGKFKQGRATAREASYTRIKRFIDAECELVDIVEGTLNNNVAQLNELGLQFRSSHKENMIPNGMVGTLIGKLLDDVYDPSSGKMLFEKGDIIDVGPGAMNHVDRKKYFEMKPDLIGQVFKFKTFPKGVKDKPRFPTFLSFRDKVDM